ncbi:hypothetical protein HK098_005667 [Nowakowskiella sp. JEL0407]|nr:hypothetical protein HK098_005667 [Nowakowskiella sp. JEL0407]
MSKINVPNRKGPDTGGSLHLATTSLQNSKLNKDSPLPQPPSSSSSNATSNSSPSYFSHSKKPNHTESPSSMYQNIYETMSTGSVTTPEDLDPFSNNNASYDVRSIESDDAASRNSTDSKSHHNREKSMEGGSFSKGKPRRTRNKSDNFGGQKDDQNPDRPRFLGNVAKSLKEKAEIAASVAMEKGSSWTSIGAGFASRAVNASIELSKQASSSAQNQYHRWRADSQETSSPPPSSQSPNFKIFGETLYLSVMRSRIDPEYAVPAVVTRCILYIESSALEEVGLYRVSGSKLTIDQLKSIFDQNGDCDDFESRVDDPHSITSLLKLYLRELPEPILTVELAPEFQKLINSNHSNSPHSQSTQNALDTAESDLLSSNPHVLPQIQHLLSLLPSENFSMLGVLSRHLARVAAMSELNKMTITNLQLIFSQTLTVPSPLLRLFIDHWATLFTAQQIKPPSPQAPSQQHQREHSNSSPSPTPKLTDRNLSIKERSRSKSRERLLADENNSNGGHAFKSISADGMVESRFMSPPKITPRGSSTEINKIVRSSSNVKSKTGGGDGNNKDESGQPTVELRRSLSELKTIFENESVKNLHIYSQQQLQQQQQQSQQQLNANNNPPVPPKPQKKGISPSIDTRVPTKFHDDSSTSPIIGPRKSSQGVRSPTTTSVSRSNSFSNNVLIDLSLNNQQQPSQSNSEISPRSSNEQQLNYNPVGNNASPTQFAPSHLVSSVFKTEKIIVPQRGTSKALANNNNNGMSTNSPGTGGSGTQFSASAGNSGGYKLPQQQSSENYTQGNSNLLDFSIYSSTMFPSNVTNTTGGATQQQGPAVPGKSTHQMNGAKGGSVKGKNEINEQEVDSVMKHNPFGAGVVKEALVANHNGE